MSGICYHVYNDVGEDVCSLCGGYTHETDWSYQAELHRRWHAEGKATYGGWWSI
jgi:hypothetical protein